MYVARINERTECLESWKLQQSRRIVCGRINTASGGGPVGCGSAGTIPSARGPLALTSTSKSVCVLNPDRHSKGNAVTQAGSREAGRRNEREEGARQSEQNLTLSQTAEDNSCQAQRHCINSKHSGTHTHIATHAHTRSNCNNNNNSRTHH